MSDIRLHIACGTVYLKDYINIDLSLPGHYLANDRPDLVEQNVTTIDNYYKSDVSKNDFMTGKYQKKAVVCDKFANVKKLNYPIGSIKEIVGMHIFEHFTFQEGQDLLEYWYELLEDGGSLRLHVPDIQGIVDSFNDDVDWGIRQLYGSQKNSFGIHKSGYTFDTLSRLLRRFSFRDIERLDNINSYPAFGIRGYK